VKPRRHRPGPQAESHHASTAATFFERLAAGHYTLPSKLFELLAFGLLVVLVSRD
jgi:hypothetical protein